MSDCGDYLVLAISEGCDPVNRLYYTNLKTLPDGINGLLPFVKVVDNFDAEYEVNIMKQQSFQVFMKQMFEIWQEN